MSFAHSIARARSLARDGQFDRARRILRDALAVARDEQTRDQIETALDALAA